MVGAVGGGCGLLLSCAHGDMGMLGCLPLGSVGMGVFVGGVLSGGCWVVVGLVFCHLLSLRVVLVHAMGPAFCCLLSVYVVLVCCGGCVLLFAVCVCMPLVCAVVCCWCGGCLGLHW